MKLTATKSVLRGRVAIPGSKSHTIRAVALASLARGSSELVEPLVSADTAAAVQCYRKLGAKIECGKSWQVTGTAGALSTPDDVIDVGNSGTTLRFGLASAALLTDGAAVFTGDHQIRKRPLGPLIASLNDLGARCRSTRPGGMAPVVIEGTMRGGQTDLEAVTSQYLSALLINAPLAEQDTVINLTVLNEKPYVEITLAYLREMGIEYQNDDMKRFVVKGGQHYESFTKRIPADFSSATFFLCAGALLDADMTICGLDFNDPQGDKAVVEILREMGADIQIEDRRLHIKRGRLNGIEVDLNATPDALPALAVLAAFADGPSHLYNVPQARLKETDRIAAMAAELSKLGADVTELPDGMIIKPAKLSAADLCGHHDHRIVMALSLAGMALPGRCTIDTAEAIEVTFANYVELMHQVGANLEMTQD